MRSMFSMDSPLMRVLGKVADLMILNIVFILTCIPIITIGPALTALNYVTLKMVEDKDIYIVRSYFKSFRQNFKQALIIWLLALLFAWLLWFNVVNIWPAEGIVNQLVKIVSIVAMVGYVLVLLYVFPVLSRFDNTIGKTILNSIGLALSAFGRTISMFMLIFASVILTFYTMKTIKFGIFFWLALGFATIAYANSFLLKKTFAKYIPEEEEEIDPWEVSDESEEADKSDQSDESDKSDQSDETDKSNESEPFVNNETTKG